MNAEFNWWLLIVGLVIGAGLTWLVMADSARREIDIAEVERPAEALWISTILSSSSRSISPDAVEEMLRLHREYLAAPPPDEVAVPIDAAPSERPAADDEATGDEP